LRGICCDLRIPHDRDEKSSSHRLEDEGKVAVPQGIVNTLEQVLIDEVVVEK
jgi:hypothetical protein